MSEERLLLGSPQSDEVLGPNGLLVAFDETGHEELADPSYPVFGLGGAVIKVRDYHAGIRLPWTQIKEKHFGGRHRHLHASDLGNATQVQLNALGDFFRNQTFGRFAAVTTLETNLVSSLSRYESTALVAAHCLGEIGEHFSFDSCAVIFEHSERADALVRRAFSSPDLKHGEQHGEQRGAKKWDVPTKFFFASKDVGEPIVEVADFVMHAAGTAVRAHRQLGIPFLNRRDFAAVFRGGVSRLASFIRLNALAPHPSSDGAA